MNHPARRTQWSPSERLTAAQARAISDRAQALILVPRAELAEALRVALARVDELEAQQAEVEHRLGHSLAATVHRVGRMVGGAADHEAGAGQR